MQVVYGGSNISSEKKRLSSAKPQILVGTPGRLLDHLSNEGLSARMRGLQSMIFDEADQLLDFGFRHAPSVPVCMPALAPFACRQQQGAFWITWSVRVWPASCADCSP